MTPEAFTDRVCGAVEFREYDEAVETGFGAFGGYDLQRSRLVTELEESLAAWADADEREWTDAETERARDIADRKYRADEWVRERTDPLG